MLKKFGLMIMGTMSALLVMVPSAFAQEAADKVATSAVTGDIKYIAAALAIGIAALGGAIGQGRAAAGAYEGVARNPSVQGKLFTMMIIGLALIESLVIYALVVSMMILFF